MLCTRNVMPRHSEAFISESASEQSKKPRKTQIGHSIRLQKLQFEYEIGIDRDPPAGVPRIVPKTEFFPKKKTITGDDRISPRPTKKRYASICISDDTT